MNGGPSQVDLFDPKPTLKVRRHSAQPRSGLRDLATAASPGRLLPSPYKFTRHGKCGMEISEVLPHLAEVRRRHRGHPLDVRRTRQPRTRALPDAHRANLCQAARPGRVGHLRPRHGESESAGLRRAGRSEGPADQRHLRTGSPAGCRRSIRARAFAPKVRRC